MENLDTWNTLVPRLATRSAIYWFTPFTSAITTIKVATDRMIPSNVRKDRILCSRSVCSAMPLASRRWETAFKRIVEGQLIPSIGTTIGQTKGFSQSSVGRGGSVTGHGKNSEQLFDFAGQFVAARQSLDRAYQVSIAGDEESGRVSVNAKLVANLGSAKDNLVVDGFLLAVHVKSLGLQEGLDDTFALFVHGHTQNHEVFVRVFFLQLNQPGSFNLAGLTPSGPEVHQHCFAAEVGEFHAF